MLIGVVLRAGNTGSKDDEELVDEEGEDANENAAVARGGNRLRRRRINADGDIVVEEVEEAKKISAKQQAKLAAKGKRHCYVVSVCLRCLPQTAQRQEEAKARMEEREQRRKEEAKFFHQKGNQCFLVVGCALKIPFLKRSSSKK